MFVHTRALEAKLDRPPRQHERGKLARAHLEIGK
jgi:hypothetical protein